MAPTPEFPIKMVPGWLRTYSTNSSKVSYGAALWTNKAAGAEIGVMMGVKASTAILTLVLMGI